jgi:GNAT superfamily N-acetyltransferase
MIRDLRAEDAVRCDEIMASLPDFFGHDGGLASCHQAVRRDRGWVAVLDDDTAVGFLLVAPMSAATFEVTWMAVAADRRRHGYGGTLIRHAIATVRADGADAICLYTSASALYKPTRAFYRANGLVEIATMTPDGWDEPGVLMVRTFDGT